MELQPINDELMIPCAACARKHLSAAIAHYADVNDIGDPGIHWKVVFARALTNICEVTEGYASHLPFAVGLIVRAEEECASPATRKALREFRLRVSAGDFPVAPVSVTDMDWFLAHVNEAEREFPDIRMAVEREPFYRDNMSEPEFRQAEVNYRLAQLRWLDENVFGTASPQEKGEKEMAKTVKKPAPKAAAKKGGCKGACKGGKSRK